MTFLELFCLSHRNKSPYEWLQEKKKKIWEQKKACRDKTLTHFLEFLLSARKKHPVLFLASVSKQGQVDGPGRFVST